MKWPAQSATETSPPRQESMQDSFETVSVPSPGARSEPEDLPLSLCRAISSLERHIEHTRLPVEVSKVTYPRGDTFYDR